VRRLSPFGLFVLMLAAWTVGLIVLAALLIRFGGLP
jgi:hypothetical protein